MKAYGKAEVQLHALTSTLDGTEWSASRPGRFVVQKEGTGTHKIGGSVGPRAGLGGFEKGNIS